MKTSFYVIFNESGFIQANKTDGFKQRPGEYACEVELEVPDEAFIKPPVPKIIMQIPADHIQRTITARLAEEED